MSDSWTCAACGSRGPNDVEQVPPKEAYIHLLKDWKVWAFAFAVTVALGMLSGALNVGTSAVGAGGGGAIAAFMMARVGKLRRCKKCSALLRG